ncbi:MAG TPA: ArsA-related P-loop ATPase [Pseudobdellovibrionaceae bacterium]|nr:ArsA-related P-loop ATPase [Pseudobdellovibrionaceae bacterium]
MNRRVLVAVGSGGVGKTTMAAALGVRARQLGRRALVLTVDPAKRLATAMGLDLSNDEVHVVRRINKSGGASEFVAKGEVYAAVIDSKKTFDDFVRRYAKDKDLIERLMRNQLYRQLSTTLAGSQEFTALERLLAASESAEYDLVILDTPPTQHALDFLSAPERIRSLFQDSITKWFMNPTESKSWVGSLLSGELLARGTRLALKSLEALTGAKFIEELIDFFASVRSIQSQLRDRSEAVQKLLLSRDTGFVLVTSFDEAKLAEAQHLQAELQGRGYRLEVCVLNRAFPEILPDALDFAKFTAAWGEDAQLKSAAQKVAAAYELRRRDHQQRFKALSNFAQRLDAKVVLLRVPEYRQDLYGIEDLEALAESLPQSAKSPDQRPSNSTPHP